MMDGGSAVSTTFLTDSLELELGTEWCKPPRFSCAFDKREGALFSGESYLASGALKRCLKVQDTESHNLHVHPYEALEAQLPSMLVDELRGLLLYIGHLAELPSVTLGAFVNQNQIKV
ncbi:MMS22-like DNA repair protein [Cricetulus griseus]